MLGITTEHAVRALTILAGLPEGQVMLGRDLAESASIPANYLSKILWSLNRAGIIGATRGSGGGYRLAKPARAIRLIDIVDLFERAEPKHTSLFRGAARENWRRVRGAYMDFLVGTTIADVAEKNKESTCRDCG